MQQKSSAFQMDLLGTLCIDVWSFILVIPSGGGQMAKLFNRQ
jgi:hypothetical protein